jgi:hypothetical protein
MIRTTQKIAFVMAAALLVLAAACGGSGKSTNASAKLAPGQDEADVKALRDAFTHLSTVKAVTADIVAQQVGANGQVANSVFKYNFVPPDRYELISSTGGISRAVGDELYTFANNVWTRQADYSGADYAGFDHFFNPKFMAGLADEIGTSATVKKGSTDTVNNKSCQQYTLTVTSTGNTTDVCIADNYPLKLVYHTGKLDTTATFSNYNGDIKIDKPTVG